MLGTWGLQYVLKILDYGLTPEPLLKSSEVRENSARSNSSAVAEKNEKNTSAMALMNGKQNGVYHAMQSTSFVSQALAFLYDSFELLFTWRGIGWQYGAEMGIRVRPSSRNFNNRAVFIVQTLVSIVTYSVICDVAHTIIRLAGITSPHGGSLFAFGGGSLLRKYASSTGLHILSGIVILAGKLQLYANLGLSCTITLA